MNFILNHPVLSLLIALFASINMFVVIAVFFGVWKEELRAKVKKQGRKIIGLLDDLTHMEETQERQAVVSLSQSIEIEMIKDQLKEAKFSPKLMPYVESVTDDYLKAIQTNDRLQKAFRIKADQVEELKVAFAEASHSLNSLQSAERDNEDLRAMYMDCLKENKELKERLRLNELKFRHKKITPEAVESDWWTPKRNVINNGNVLFLEGIAYRKRETMYPMSSPTLMNLWSSNKSYQVAKSDFYPCSSTGKVAKHVL